MREPEHTIERRAAMLATKMQQRVDILRDFMRPEGARPPFTQLLQEQRAMQFWAAHRYDELGARVLQNMTPQHIAELDAALAQSLEAQRGPIAS